MVSTGALILSCAAAMAAAAPSGHAKRASSDPFQIYAYGTGIGGLAMFSAGGDTYFGDWTQWNDTNAAPVIVTPQDGDVWMAAPNTTALNGTAPNWSNYTFSVPSASASTHNVTLLSSNASTTDRQTSGFVYYGSYIMVESESDGTYESLWYATASDISGIYTLKWNQTGDDTSDQITLSLRKTAPSN